jgi:hypothetical protein
VHGTAASARLLAEADVVLAFGTSISPFTTCGGHLVPSVRTVVHCDVVATARVSAPVTLRLPGDAADVADALTTVITRRGRAQAGYRTAHVRSVIKAGRGPIKGDLGTPGQFVDPRQVLDWLDQRLPEARTVVPEPSHAAGYALEHLRVHQKRGGISLFDFQSIGLGLAASVGAAVAHPGRITVSVVGDGGALMSLGELETMVRYRLPILVVVLNDAAYGAEARELQLRGLPIADEIMSDPLSGSSGHPPSRAGAHLWAGKPRTPPGRSTKDCQSAGLVRPDGARVGLESQHWRGTGASGGVRQRPSRRVPGSHREAAIIGTRRSRAGIKIPHGSGDPWGKRVSEGDSNTCSSHPCAGCVFMR